MVAPLTPTQDLPVMPERFAGTPGEPKWHALMADLRARGFTVHPADADRIAEYVDAFLDYTAAVARLAGEELVLVTPTGQRRVNPLIDVKRRTQQVMLAVSRQYGFDPVSRRRLKGDAPKPKANPFAFDPSNPRPGPRVVNGVALPPPPCRPTV